MAGVWGQRRSQASPGHPMERALLVLVVTMTLLEFILYLAIAGICGAIARAVVGGTPGGFVVSILVGFLGAFIGVWLARMLHWPRLFVVAVEGHPFPIVWSIIGGMILVAVAHALTGRPRHGWR